MPVEPIAPALLAWYAAEGRHDLPWRQTRDPYALWLAEIMLQQTQVATVLPYYARFLERFPTVQALATAELDEVLHLWTGLGYYARARNLHAAARRIVSEHGGQFPQDLDTLMRLPGIGRSTAGAILSSAFDQSHPILDGNVKRVLSRYYAYDADPGNAGAQHQLWAWAAEQTPLDAAHDYNQAIQDLGATVCRRGQPQCLLCPLQAGCQAFAQGLSAVLPRARRRSPQPVRSAWLGIIRDAEGRVLLQRQGPGGLWGGLWTLPQVARGAGDSPADAAAAFAELLGAALQAGPAWPAARHSFTHFHLDYVPVELRLAGAQTVRDSADWLWVAPAQPGRRGLARPTQRILQQLAGAAPG